MKYLAALLFALITTNACAANDAAPQSSLFFSAEESHVAEALASKTMPAGLADIRLGAVMYYGPDDWTLWLQNERWTPQTARKNLQIIDVRTDQVHLSWRGEDDAEAHDITLRPNETFQIATGRIVSNP